MKVAIPHWHGRVSPVFDVACTVRIVAVDEAEGAAAYDVSCQEADPRQRMALLSAHGVSVLICGAISCGLERVARTAGIRVVSQVCGDVDEVASAFAEGKLRGPGFRMPGCRRHRRRCGR